jgi:ABC-type antimicrobial peptide transport system permease subunit
MRPALSRTRLVLRSLSHFRRTNAAVVAGVAICTAVLTGSLLVGDSAQGSLVALEELRTGHAVLALRAPGRTVRAALADDLSRDLGAPVAPVLQVPATVSGMGGETPGVRLYGVDLRFFDLGSSPLRSVSDEVVLASRAAADVLGRPSNNTVAVRVGRLTPIQAEIPLAVDPELKPFLAELDGVVDDDRMGRFSLSAGADAPLNAFTSLSSVAQHVQAPGRANILLVGPRKEGLRPEFPTPAEAATALRRSFRLSDANASVFSPAPGTLQLRSDRIFLDPPLAKAGEAQGGRGVLAWFVDEIRFEHQAAPYSAVVAVGPDPRGHAAESDTLLRAVDELHPGELLVNDWLAADLGLSPGDTLELRYDVFGPAHRMVLKVARFRVHAVVPLAGAAADPTWMPDVPGLTDIADCRQWEPGFPVDIARIRPKDSDYWRDHRGTPKAFLRLDDGERLFGSRYGNRTAVRFESAAIPDSLSEAIASAVDPAELGLTFAPLHRSSTAAVDFGPLFLGFGFVLVVSALILTALLFSFGIEQRAGEVGTLLALGFRPRDLRVMLAAEALVLALAGAAIGTPLGVLFTKAVLAGLSSVWREAVGLPALQVHLSVASLAAGAAAGLSAGLLGLLVVLAGHLRTATSALLAGPGAADVTNPPRWSSILSFVMAGSAVGLVIFSRSGRGLAMAEAFFGAGSLLLIAGILAAHALLVRAGQEADSGRAFLRRGTLGLALGGAGRRRGRSLATIGLLAAGAFLVVGVGGNRQDPSEGAGNRGNGTGGFALLVTAAEPIARDLNLAPARSVLGLDPKLPASFVGLRVHEGDEASCRSPGRAAVPRVMGVDPEGFAHRGSFTFTSAEPLAPEQRGSPWRLLARKSSDGTIPAIGDEGTVIWSLHAALGDVVETVDGLGRPLRLRIVGITATSLLQGGLIISEDNFLALFPGDGGYRLLLVDAAAADLPGVQQGLTAVLRDRGVRVEPAWRALAVFQAVENTYLAIFQALGALGLLLGCAGIGILVLRHALDRRGELAVLSAMGFPRGRIRRLLVLEHALLVLLGLAIGSGAALISLLPMLHSPGTPVPVWALVRDLAAVGAAGLIATWLAGAASLRMPLAEALREES